MNVSKFGPKDHEATERHRAECLQRYREAQTLVSLARQMLDKVKCREMTRSELARWIDNHASPDAMREAINREVRARDKVGRPGRGPKH